MTADKPTTRGPHAQSRTPGTEIGRLGERVMAELEAQLQAPLAPGLYLVATPIGHLADITIRALAVLAGADTVYCEDTRQSQKLLARYGIDRRLDRYHEHNAERERPRILARLAAAGTVALVSDAGTPLVSDPGYKLAREAIAQGHAVWAIPGPSATLAALAVSGLPTDSFHFAGFLPPRSAARRARIAELAPIPSSLILFETAPRLPETLGDLAALLGAREAAVARELTKLHEEVQRGTLQALAAEAATHVVKGEIVIVVGPPVGRVVTDAQIVEALRSEPAGASLRDNSTAVATRLGVGRSRVYDLALSLQRDGKGRADE